VEKTQTYLGCYSPPTAAFLTPEVLQQADALFDRAEDAVRGDPARLRHVQTARLPLLYLYIVRGESEYVEEKNALVPVQKAHLGWVTRFEERARAVGVTHTREGSPNIEEWLTARRNQATDLAIERLQNAHVELSLLPRLGGRIWRLRHKPTGKEIIKPVTAGQGFQPSEGGYEEYGQMDYRSCGWSEAYEVRKRTRRPMELEADIRNGFRLTRRITLDAGKPCVRISSTLLNRTKERRPACLRIHPTFSVADTAHASVWRKAPDGHWHRQSLATRDEPPAGKEITFRGETCPAGEWALVDENDDMALVNRFSPGQVAVCYLNWSGRQQRVNIELWSPKVELGPGETITIEHEYEIVHPADGRFR
jgi:hypothetical protein